VRPRRQTAEASAAKVSAEEWTGRQPSWVLALVVSITTDVRATCSHSSMEGTNGTREIAADAAEAAAAGTRTGLPPSAFATSATVTMPSPAMLYAPGGAGAVAANAIAAATSS
jgi:hypothetical protein